MISRTLRATKKKGGRGKERDLVFGGESGEKGNELGGWFIAKTGGGLV